MYVVNADLCTFCKNCLEECPTSAIIEGKAGDKDVCVVTADCIDCGACEEVCEPGALGFPE